MEDGGEYLSDHAEDGMSAATAGVEIIVSAASRVNFASAQNAVPVIRSLALRNCGDEVFEGLRLTLSAQPPFLREKIWVIDRLDAEGQIPISDRDLTLDLAFLDKLNEAERGQLGFTLTAGGAMRGLSGREHVAGNPQRRINFVPPFCPL